MARLGGFLQRYLIIGLVGLVAVLAVVVATGERGVPQPRPTPAEGVEAVAQETMVARVVEVLETGTVDLHGDGPRPYQRLRLRVESGSLAGQEVTVEDGTLVASSEERLFRPGDRVYVERMAGPSGEKLYISDLERSRSLLLIAGLFVALVLLAGRVKGLRSLVGTLFSLVVILGFIVPQILAGRDPLTVSIAGAIALLAVSNYLIYGWHAKAHAAMGGMAVSLVLTGLLAWASVGLIRLSGLSGEESTYLMMELGPGIRLQRLVLGGIIIGCLGVLDDVCVGQASAVFEIAKANANLGWRELFRHSLSIGQDHIAATINTLLLAYVGASLPLMLLFSIYQEPLLRRLSREPIAEEILRTLVGSMGLILAMPITGLIASLLAERVAGREAGGLDRQAKKG